MKALSLSFSLLALCVIMVASISSPDSNYPYHISDSIPFTDEQNQEYFYSAAAAYCNVSWLTNFNCGTICNNLTGYQYFSSYTIAVDSDDTLQYIMLVNPSSEKFITSFKGTKGVAQLIHEGIDLGPMDYTIHNLTGAQVVQYFGGYYIRSLRQRMLIDLEYAISLYANYLFAFTGHSLGAAFATLAGQDAILGGYLESSSTVLYTYGSPRVGNWIWASNVDSLFGGSYRVVHYHDLVPHVPFCSVTDTNCELGTGFLVWQAWHIGVQKWYTNNSESYQTCTGNYGEDLTCSDSVSILQTSIEQHKNYFGIEVGQTCIDDNSGSSDDNSGKSEDEETSGAASQDSNPWQQESQEESIITEESSEQIIQGLEGLLEEGSLEYANLME